MNIVKLTLNFAKAAAKYIKKGMPNVTPTEYKERLKACQRCEHRQEGTHTNSCGLCGCIIEIKAQWATNTCPDNPSKWPEVKVTKKT